MLSMNTLRPRRNEQHFADDIFKRIFFNENAWISIKISLKFVPKDPINNIPALVQIMAWRHSGDKPLSEPMMASLPTHKCVTRPQWVNMVPTDLEKCLIFQSALKMGNFPWRMLENDFMALKNMGTGKSNLLVCYFAFELRKVARFSNFFIKFPSLLIQWAVFFTVQITKPIFFFCINSLSLCI